MAPRYVFAVGLAAMAALAAWAAIHRRAERPFDIDDDTAADIIRRFAPALHDAWASQTRVSA
jgi:hypothetical protein